MGTPFRPDGSGPRSAALEKLGWLWDQAEHRLAAISGDRLTQKWLAKESGVPLATINGWATGAHLPRDLDQLTKVGAALAKAARVTPLKQAEWSWLQIPVPPPDPSRRSGEEPVVAIIDRHHLTAPHFSELVVDADPPQPMWRSGIMLGVTVKARPGRAATVHGMRPIELVRQPPRRACFGLAGSYVAGVVPRRMFTMDLGSDRIPLRAEDEDEDFPFTISAIKGTVPDIEYFRVTIYTTDSEVSFRLGIDWHCTEYGPETTVIDNDGEPFKIYPDGHSDLHWGCGGRHERGCPAEILAANSSRGRVRWFDESLDAGFIVPNCGGADLYFHRTSLASGQSGRHPRKGDLVAYEAERTRFEPRAVRVRFLD